MIILEWYFSQKHKGSLILIKIYVDVQSWVLIQPLGYSPCVGSEIFPRNKCRQNIYFWTKLFYPLFFEFHSNIIPFSQYYTFCYWFLPFIISFATFVQFCIREITVSHSRFIPFSSLCYQFLIRTQKYTCEVLRSKISTFVSPLLAILTSPLSARRIPRVPLANGQIGKLDRS